MEPSKLVVSEPCRPEIGVASHPVPLLGFSAFSGLVVYKIVTVRQGSVWTDNLNKGKQLSPSTTSPPPPSSQGNMGGWSLWNLEPPKPAHGFFSSYQTT